MRRPSEQLEAFFLTKAMVLAFLVPLLVHEVKHNIKFFFWNIFPVNIEAFQA